MAAAAGMYKRKGRRTGLQYGGRRIVEASTTAPSARRVLAEAEQAADAVQPRQADDVRRHTGQRQPATLRDGLPLPLEQQGDRRRVDLGYRLQVDGEVAARDRRAADGQQFAGVGIGDRGR